MIDEQKIDQETVAADPRIRTLITDPAQRELQREKSRGAVLHFLRDETWSTSDVLREVVGMESRQGIHSLLKKMERDELVRSHKLLISGRQGLQIWGITPHGIGMSFDTSEAFEDRPSFDPSRLALSRVPHQVELQRVRLRAEKAGWTGWKRGERLGFQTPLRPDALVKNTQGVAIAIEVERTIKSAKRYRQIMSEHLSAIYARQWGAVFYLCDPTITQRVKKIYDSIDYVLMRGERIEINEQHRERFKFFDLEGGWETCSI